MDHRVTSEDEWYIHPDTHQALVSHEDFAKVKDIYLQHAEKMKEWAVQYQEDPTTTKHLFSTHLICKDCGRPMFFQKAGNYKYICGKHTSFYTCSRKKNDTCRNRVYEDYLSLVVQEQIRNLFKYLFAQKGKIKELRESSNEKSVLYSNEKKLVHLKKKESDYEQLMSNLYKDLSDKVIDEDDYKFLNDKYYEEKKAITDQIQNLNETVYKMKRWINSFEDLGERLSQSLSEDVDIEKLVDDLVGKIYYSSSGTVEIEFTCNDVIEKFMS
jgi:hypothetical protein